MTKKCKKTDVVCHMSRVGGAAKTTGVGIVRRVRDGLASGFSKLADVLRGK